MSKTLSLFRTTLQSSFDSPKAKKKRAEGKGKGRPARAADRGRAGGNTAGLAGRIIAVLIGLLIASAVLALFYWIATRIYNILEASGGGNVFVDLIFAGIAITLAGFGFMFFMQEMYYSEDIPVYMYLPIKKSQILTFRFVKVLIQGGFIVIAVLLPFFVAYGVKSSAGLAYIPYAFLVLLLAPIIPLTVIGLISMLLMRFTKGLKSKQAVSVVAFVGGAIGVQFVLQSFIQSFNPALMGGLAEAGEILSVVYIIFPGTGFAANALELSGTSALINLGYFIAASAAAFGLFLLAGKFLYFEGLVGIGEHASRREAISSDDLEKKTAASPKPVTYMRKEFRQIRRSLAAFFNLVVNPVLLFPGIMIFGLLRSGNDDLESLLEYVDGGLVVGAIIGMCVIFSIMNPVFASIISREGSSFHIMKFIPMSIESQLRSKMSVGFVLGLIPCLLIGTALAFLGIPLEYIATGLLGALLIIAALAMTGAIIDLKRPKLNWTDVSRVLMMSLNFVIYALTGVVYVAIAALPIIISIILNWGLPIWAWESEVPLVDSLVGYITYIVVEFGAVDLLLYWWINRNAKRLIMQAS